ncbi:MULTISPECIES: bacteriocin immunity protein [unclassified Pseudomonas]|uniref:bacteriocin immunity protein n=1 Tax=unclassified Pseudomonas TaxID=196821 RepID=UPI0016462A1A|nr:MULTISPECIES: bacteriocin immunity protein [unclassified Pseudomonas]MBC3363243.1 bacteriocin immunity protein [Pseudomonas sp. SWRI154]MCL6703777.1 bacteriocin immunity protein [Pseudomonas sp. T1.Ur]
MNSTINDMSESEFLAFVRKIYEADYYPEEAHTNAVLEFERISEHPSGSDLLYYPEAGKSGPEAVVKEVKKWRSANGKPGFKQP